MSAPRTTSRANGEPERFSVGSALPPMLARELANRRAREELERYAGEGDGGGDLDRPRHARSDGDGGRARPVGAGAVAAAGIGFVICAVLAAVAVLWPRDDGRGDGIEASGVTTTEAPFDDVADRGLGDAATAQAPATAPTTEGATTTGSTEGAGDGTEGSGDGTEGSGGGEPPPETTAPPQTAPPSTQPAPAPTQPPQPQPQQPPTVRPGDPGVDATWDALAQCESHGNWSADPGNGRYGGLMIDDDTWDRYGGDGRPHRHSRETQIAVARRIQDARGWDYWDDCARDLGFDD